MGNLLYIRRMAFHLKWRVKPSSIRQVASLVVSAARKSTARTAGTLALLQVTAWSIGRQIRQRSVRRSFLRSHHPWPRRIMRGRRCGEMSMILVSGRSCLAVLQCRGGDSSPTACSVHVPAISSNRRAGRDGLERASIRPTRSEACCRPFMIIGEQSREQAASYSRYMGRSASGARRRGRNEGSVYKDEANGRWYCPWPPPRHRPHRAAPRTPARPGRSSRSAGPQPHCQSAS